MSYHTHNQHTRLSETYFAQPESIMYHPLLRPVVQSMPLNANAYERLATKVMRLSLKPNSSNDNSINNKRIQFFTVSLDKNNDNAITKLMHMLQIKKIPQGIIHHPTQCLFGHKIGMNRSNLSILKQQLERYLLEDDIKIDAMMLNGKM